MDNIVIIDAYAHIYRNYYAMSKGGAFQSPDGQPVGAIFGMARLLMQIENSLKPKYAAVAFDKGKPKYRCELLPEYKAQRPPMPDDLRAQVQPIREWFLAFGWNIVEEEGREADDLIAAIVKLKEDCSVDILAFDKDIMQLVQPNVRLLAPGKNATWIPTEEEQVQEKFGVAPEMLPAYLALLGDSSDNVKGVDGVGPKTAAKLLNDFNGIDGLIQNIDNIEPKRIQDNIRQGQDILDRNMKLITLDSTTPKGFVSLEQSIKKKEPDWKRIKELAEALAFKSMIPAIDKAAKAQLQPTLF
jgi:DNA polymerase-1